MVLVAYRNEQKRTKKEKRKSTTVNHINDLSLIKQPYGLVGEQPIDNENRKYITQLADKYAKEIEQLVGENKEEFEILLFTLKGSCSCPSCLYIRSRLESVISNNIYKLNELKKVME